MNHLIDAKIAKVIESYSGTLEEDELEGLSDQFVDMVSAAMNEAYRTGAKHCLKLMIDTLND